MFISIIKDSIILFLLMYALIDLCRHFTHLLSKWLYVEPPQHGIYLWDATCRSVCSLECSLRSIAAKQSSPVYVIFNIEETEKYEILIRLYQEYDNIIPVTREECLNFITSGIYPTVFSVHNKAAVPFPDK